MDSPININMINHIIDIVQHHEMNSAYAFASHMERSSTKMRIQEYPGMYLLIEDDLKSSIFYYSTDCIHWSTGHTPTDEAGYLTYWNSKFVYCTNDGVRYTSEDGMKWSRISNYTKTQ